MMKGFSIQYKNQQLHIESNIQEGVFDNFTFTIAKINFGFEGVLLNLTPLLNKYAAKGIAELFFKLYSQRGILFLDELEGEFSGFIYDEDEQKLYGYTNFTATKKLFYYFDKGTFILDTSLASLSQTLKDNFLSISLDSEACYAMLVCSNMLEDMTPLQGIKKLRNGEAICFNLKEKTKEIIDYTRFNSISPFLKTKSKAIDILHETFAEGVQLAYKKDEELGLSPLALLSGGLDSRVSLFYALQSGFKPKNILCFSQKGYWDEKISRKIASDYNLPFSFVPLNGGKYLMNIDRMTGLTEGLVLYTGAMHVNFAYQFIKKENLGLIHTGQLGDGVLGGYNTHPFKHLPSTFRIVHSFKLFPKFKNIFQEITKNYDSEELFLLRNVGYNHSVIGSYVAEEFSYLVSPFMYSHFVKFTSSLPEKWKFNQVIYMEWVNKHCKQATKYIWERTLLKPNAAWKIPIGDQVVKRAYNITMNHILKMTHKGKMTAYEYYYNKDQDIKTYLNQYFEDTISLLNGEVQNDAVSLFKQGTFNEKILVISLLATAKKYLV